jgi:hypothetical protein
VEGGTVVDKGNNDLLYTPLSNFSGSDSFDYIVTDGKGGIAGATVNVTVNAVNQAPVCQDVSLTTDVDTALAINVQQDLVSTCTDVDSPTLTLTGTTAPMHGTLTDNGAGVLTYTPAAAFQGTDRFTYTVSDNSGNSDTKTVSIAVGVVAIFGNFTMIDAGGSTFGGTNDIVANLDLANPCTSTSCTNFGPPDSPNSLGSQSNFPFFGFPWSAHDIRVFGPGSYSFDTTCTPAQLESGVANCGGAPDQYLQLTVGPGQFGAHLLFDWNITKNIDVVVLWDQNGSFAGQPPGALYQGPAGPTPVTDCSYQLVSRDADGDGIPGAKMIDGPFVNFQANFNVNLTQNLCTGGAVTSTKSTVNSPSLGGGCTVLTRLTTPLTRGDLWLIVGFISWLGVISIRRRKRL